MKKVFESSNLKKLKLKNRLIRSATWEGIASEDGSVSEETYEIYDKVAKGGIGAIITGFTSVRLDDFYFDGMMRLCNDSLIPQYRKLTEVIHKENIPAISQLALGGYYRKLEDRFELVEPNDMTKEEITSVSEDFINAGLRAQKAGFDGVQIHAAHFFFLSRFISPALNNRTDEYGGTTENRTKILTEILRGIRAIAPALHISIKLNCNDFTYRGLDEEESLKICCLLDREGIDSIEISGNGTSVPGIKAHKNEGYFSDAAALIAHEVSCPVIAVGGFRSVDFMEKVLNTTDIEFISLSRPIIREPDLPVKMQNDPKTISRCTSCNRCYSTPAHRCIFDLRGYK